MAYANGQVPFSVLIHLGANFWLPAGTAARWLWFVAEGVRRFGVTFRITPDRDGLGGWNAYRPYAAQVIYRKHYGNMAAVAGFSSHGGFYQGREVFAIDVDNWAAVPWAEFTALAAEAGFRTNFVTPTERWHIGDFNNPWSVPSFAGGQIEDSEMNAEEWRQFQVMAGTVNEMAARVANVDAWISAGGAGVDQGLAANGTLAARVINIDRQVTGADGFDKNIGPSVASRVIAIQNKPAATITDAQVKAIADAVAKQVGAPTANIDYAKIAKDVRAEFKTNPLTAS